MSEYQQMDQEQLLKDCLKGKASAQRALYVHFAGPMLGLCYRYTKSMEDAQDVLQDGFIKIYKNLNQFKGTGDLGAWIRRIMVNTAISYLKKESRYQYDLSFEDNSLHPVSDDNPEISLNVKELAELIRQLPSGYQTIFNLYAVEGYNHREIGKILGIQEGTSKSQYARARALLISWITKHSEDTKTDMYARR
jgi:RNA polymerase sigma factor (sigma-70 family)